MSSWSRNGRSRSGWSGGRAGRSRFANLQLEELRFEDGTLRRVAGNEIVRAESLRTQGDQPTRYLSQDPRWGMAIMPPKKEQPVAEAAARFDAILGLLPARMLPARINSEVVGDALERIGAAAEKGRSRWYLRALFAITLLVVLLEVVRYVARGIKGEKALRR